MNVSFPPHLGSQELANQKAALQHVQNHIAQDSVYQAFPCISTASNKHKAEYETIDKNQVVQW